MNPFTTLLLLLAGFAAGVGTLDAGVGLWHAQIAAAGMVTGSALFLRTDH